MIDTIPMLNAMQRVARASGLRFELDPECDQPCTDLETGVIYARTPRSSWTEEEVMLWLGQNYHEAGHHHPRVKDALEGMRSREIGFNCELGRVINIVEDWRNEITDRGRFAGRCDVQSRCQAYYCAKGAKALAAAIARGDDPTGFMTNVFGWIYNARGEWQPHMVIPAMAFSEHCDYAHWEVLYADLWAMETFDDVYNLVIKLYDLDPTKDAEKAKEEAKKAAKAESGGKEEGEGGEGESGEGGEEGEGEGKGGEIPYEELMGHVHSGEMKGKDSYGKIIYSEGRRDYMPYQDHEYEKIKARDIEMSPRGARYSVGTEEEIKKHHAAGSKLSSKVKRLFQSVSQTRTEHNHKSGRLDKRDLYRVRNGDRDVFTRKSVRVNAQGTVLYVLTDASGSMSGERFDVTAAAVALLLEAMKPLNIPIKVAAYTEREDKGCQHFIIKDFSEIRSTAKVIDDYTKVASKLYQNADGDTLMLAYREIMARKEPRKIILVLSDGMPCCDRAGNADRYMREVSELVQKNVEVYGIGIQSDSVKRYYKDNVVLRNTSELESCLLEVVKKKFL